MSKLKIIIYSIFLIACFFSISCGNRQSDPKTAISEIAESYVKLLLKTGQYDENVVDAYYGTEDWKVESEPVNKEKLSLDSLRLKSMDVLENLKNVDTTDFEELWKLRYVALENHIVALKTKIEILMGKEFSFDEEFALIFATVAPKRDIDSLFAEIEILNKKLPGEEHVLVRYENLKKKFRIPEDKLELVVRTVVKECKERVEKHLNLPVGDSISLEFVTDKPWTAYNWYKGNGYSHIQVNKDRPFSLTTILDYLSHETYPGHHVHLSFQDITLYRKNHWVEYSIQPLFAPVSLVSEGIAENACRMLFTQKEKKQYLEEVIAPLAGIDTTGLNDFLLLSDKLSGITDEIRMEIDRLYLNDQISREQFLEFLQNRLYTSETNSRSSLNFIENYGIYRSTYAVATPIIADYLKVGTNEDADEIWNRYEWLVSTPPTITTLSTR